MSIFSDPAPAPTARVVTAPVSTAPIHEEAVSAPMLPPEPTLVPVKLVLVGGMSVQGSVQMLAEAVAEVGPEEAVRNLVNTHRQNSLTLQLHGATWTGADMPQGVDALVSPEHVVGAAVHHSEDVHAPVQTTTAPSVSHMASGQRVVGEPVPETRR